MIFFKKERMIILPLLFIIYGCDSKRDALGADNEIRVICSEMDRNNIELFLRSIFNDTLYTPEPEPYYFLKFSNPDTYSRLKNQTNIVVAAIERDFTNSGLDLVKNILPEQQFKATELNDPLILAKDVHSKNQLFMVINSNSIDNLMEFVDVKRNFIRKHFNDQFKFRQGRFLFSENNYNALRDSLKEQFGWSLKLPWGWEIIRKVPDSNFVWLGKEMPYQWIGVGWVNGNIVEDELFIGNYIWEWPKNNYKTIQFSDYKFELSKDNYNDFPAWRLTGVWETVDFLDPKGGPFRSYVFYDPGKDLTYHINYLIFYPGNPKSIFFRQADMILKTFQIY